MSSRALKHCLASDRRSRIPLSPNLTVCCCTKISFTRCFRPMLACANIGATSNRLNTGRAQNRIGIGGSDFCAIRVGPASGTNSSPFAVALKRCMSMSGNRWGFLRFATSMPATGDLFSARGRLRRAGMAERPAPYTEKELS